MNKTKQAIHPVSSIIQWLVQVLGTLWKHKNFKDPSCVQLTVGECTNMCSTQNKCLLSLGNWWQSPVQQPTQYLTSTSKHFTNTLRNPLKVAKLKNLTLLLSREYQTNYLWILLTYEPFHCVPLAHCTVCTYVSMATFRIVTTIYSFVSTSLTVMVKQWWAQQSTTTFLQGPLHNSPLRVICAYEGITYSLHRAQQEHNYCK